ncbi:MAG: glycosyltransferase family 2 protein [Acetobacteraceae bacterium]
MAEPSPRTVARAAALPSRLVRRWHGLRWRVARARRRLWHRPRHFLSVYAIFQNEAHIIREWMDLHLREGVEHFFLLDHGSSDDWRERIAEHVAAGRVTVRRLASAEGSLDWLRVVHAHFALDGTEWMIFQDLDEFTYAPGARSLPDYLRRLPAGIDQVVMPWVRFGTAGCIEQPRHVVPANTRCENIAGRVALSDSTHGWPVKSIVRCRNVTMLRAHIHLVRGRTVLPFDEPEEITGEHHIPNRLAARIGAFRILQNHYIHQSFDFYRRKMERRGYWLNVHRNTSQYSLELFARDEAYLNAEENTVLLDKHRAYYESSA